MFDASVNKIILVMVGDRKKACLKKLHTFENILSSAFFSFENRLHYKTAEL